MSLLIRRARVLTMGGPGPRRGPALGDLGVIPAADVRVEGDRVAAVSAEPLLPRAGEAVIDAGGRVVMPAFVDAHTHACFAGDRLDEWEMKLAGRAYLDILKAGGGIMATVRAVRDASESDLAHALHERLDRFLHAGTTTLEIKSGYGLSTEAELKMLRAIASAAHGWPGRVVPTALLGHALDPDAGPGFVERTIRETLPAVHAEFPGIAIDAFVEKGAWRLEDTRRLFERARDLGHPVRVHADQFTSLGMVEEAVRLGALSVDHLEASTPEALACLAASATFAVGLPCTGLHLMSRAGASFADLRRLVDAGGLAVIATNLNPGSSPAWSMPLAMAMGVRGGGLDPREAVAAATINPAELLGFADRGWIGTGARADLLLLRHADERALAFELGADPVEAVICGGRIVRGGTPN